MFKARDRTYGNFPLLFFSILDHKGLSVIAVSASNLTFMCCNPASRHTVGSLCANNLVK